MKPFKNSTNSTDKVISNDSEVNQGDRVYLLIEPGKAIVTSFDSNNATHLAMLASNMLAKDKKDCLSKGEIAYAKLKSDYENRLARG